MEKEEIKELKEILINFSSVIAGVLAIIIIGAVLLLMFFCSWFIRLE